MTAIPIYNLIILPGVTFYFRGEYFKQISGTDVQQGDELTFLFLKEEKERAEMTAEDFYPVAVFGRVIGINENGDVSVHAEKRIQIDTLQVDETSMELTAYDRPDIMDLDKKEEDERFHKARNAFIKYLSGYQWGVIARNYVMNWKSMAEIMVAVSSQVDMNAADKYAIVEEDSMAKRTDMMEQVIYDFLELQTVSAEAETVTNEMDQKQYRENAIKKQIQILQQELDEMHPENETAVRKFEKKIAESGMNDTARAEAEKVLNRMKQEGQNSAEYGLLYDYLDFVTGLDWHKPEMEPIDLGEAEQILDSEHYGLKKVKSRILQQIAVMTLNKKQSGSILLFVGAPGTGKTSIGQSIARALHRKYVRISLGGVRDEAEIRGHRRTYIGAMPGRIMDGIQKSGVSNPVVVLDEVDKLTRDFNGDPSSALLEVLDPEQNSTFTDHYMNVPYDLSNVFFVCTANTTDTIPEPLLNRMEVIEFQGYTASEKFEIARRHLIPREMEAAGIKKSSLKISDSAIRTIISDYTMEAGVRGLKKRFDTLCRVAAVKLVRGDQKTITVSPRKLPEYLDMKPIHHDSVLSDQIPGIVTGLAWTMAGGEILFIETMFTKGNGKLIITGQLGDVMKESVQIAVSLVKSKFPEKADAFENHDLHIHVPEGAVPKDGPSAGITLTTALASLLTEKPVDPAIAMTGEVSLRGRVMPIGGLPEKLMAAQRAGVKTVFIPQENKKDLDDVAEEVKESLRIVPVKTVDDVLRKTGLMKKTRR